MLKRELEYFLGAIRFFTRLPVPAWVGHSAEALNSSARYFSAVGLVVGGIAAAVYALAGTVWPPQVAILLSMVATLYATGAFHEDGLSDAVDGLGGGWEREQVLAIMKDSRIGSFGAVALVMGLLLKFTALAALPAALLPAILVAGHVVSRFASTTLIFGLDYVRDEGKSKPLAHRLGVRALAFSAIVPAAVLAGLPWPAAGLGALLAAAATLWLGRRFKRRIGGYTGDCLGAAQQIAEIAFYLGLLCVST